MKQQSLKKWIPVIAVVLLIFWVSKQVQYRHKFVENMEADKLLSQSEKDELVSHYAYMRDEGMLKDASKLSNKAKLVVNIITDHPLSAVTDNVVGKIIEFVKNDPHTSDSVKAKLTPELVKIKLVNTVIESFVLRLLFAYQDIYSKSTKEPTRAQFEADIVLLAMKDRGIPFALGMIQKVINVSTGKIQSGQSYIHFKDLIGAGPFLIDLVGTTPTIESSPTSENQEITLDLSGPLQRNVVDVVYAYFYPTPDFFTWIKKLIFG